MSFEPETLLGKLAQFADLAGEPERIVVAFSGGLDSTVLLSALAVSRDVHRTPLLAVHVNHGLHEDASAWAAHCGAMAASLDVDFASIDVNVDVASGRGVEAAAREARYGALRSLLHAGDWLLSAHHKDDQAETLLLNLMRGSGPAGLAGIGEFRPLVTGWLVRPLLDVSRNELLEYANGHALEWIDDPANEDRQFDRNFLRHEVLPVIETRWPDAAGRLRRSAMLCGEAAQLLDQLADADLVRMGDRPDRLALDKLHALPVERQRNLLRYVIRELGLPAPPATLLASVITDLIPAREDAQPLVAWPGVELRRFRDRVYVLAVGATDTMPPAGAAFVGDRLILAPGLGELRLERGAMRGLAEAVLERRLEVRYRRGGEEIKPLGQTHTRKLKKLLQEEGVVPWMRDKIPLVYADGELVAVADLWIAAGAAGEPGAAIYWHDRPALH